MLSTLLHKRSTTTAATKLARLFSSNTVKTHVSTDIYGSASPYHVPTQYASKEVDPYTAPPPSHSIIQKFLTKSKMSRVPLSEQWPHESLPILPPTTKVEDVLNVKPQISTLANGLRVVTIPSVSPVASVGIFTDVGTRYETPETAGFTHFLELMSLKSTRNRTDFRLVREMLKMGATVSASSSREHVLYSADGFHEHVPALIGTFADIIQNNIFHVEELAEEKIWYERDAEEREKMIELKMMENIHEAAYSGLTLGNSLYTPMESLDLITPQSLKSFQRKFFTPKRMVVAAVGVDHKELSTLVSEAFLNLSNDSVLPEHKAKAIYTGGEIRSHKKNDPNGSHIALAFQTADWHADDLIYVCLLQVLMGGGGSFSAGGPGKGMHSRIYRNVLNRYEWAQNVTSFNSIFSDSGLFGLYGVTSPDRSQDMVDVLAKECVGMSDPIDDVALGRAKNQLKSSLLYTLESRAMRCEDIGRQVSVYGRVQDPKKMFQQIDSATEKDIHRVVEKMFKSPLTLVANGDVLAVPRYDLIQRHFK